MSTETQRGDRHGWIGTETVKTRFGDFAFTNGYPTAQATDDLYAFRTFYRAVETYLSLLPIISMNFMQKGSTTLGSKRQTRS